jgi:hypothetical protein
MKRLSELQVEYEEVRKRLAFPLNIGERAQPVERRNKIRQEAQGIAESLNIPPGDHWFNS